MLQMRRARTPSVRAPRLQSRAPCREWRAARRLMEAGHRVASVQLSPAVRLRTTDAARVSLLIHVESPPRLTTEPSGGYVLPEQRTGSIPRVSKTLVQHLENRETGVQPDEVGKCERTHGMVHAELHHGVNGLRSPHTFHEAANRLVDHRHEYPVGNEAGIIVGLHRLLAEFPGERHHS